jgi:hypothetical protein
MNTSDCDMIYSYRKRKPFHEKSPLMHDYIIMHVIMHKASFMERDLSLSPLIKPRFSQIIPTCHKVRVTKVKNATKNSLKFFKEKD